MWRRWHKSQWCWNSSVGYQNCTRTEDLPTKLPQSISTTLHAMRRPRHSLTRRCRFSANLLHQGKIHSVRTRKMSRILTPPLGPCTHFGPKEVSNYQIRAISLILAYPPSLRTYFIDAPQSQADRQKGECQTGQPTRRDVVRVARWRLIIRHCIT